MISQIIFKNIYILCNTYIHINTFKIKHNFYHKNINNQSIFFLKKKTDIITHILKFLPKFNTTYDHFFFNF